MVEKSAAVTGIDLGFSLETSHLNRLTDDDFEILSETSGSHFIKLSQLRGVSLIEGTQRNDFFWGVRMDFPDAKSVYLKLWYKDENIARKVHDTLLNLKREDLERIALIRKKNAAQKTANESEIRTRSLQVAETPAPLERQTGSRRKTFFSRLFKRA